MKLTSIYQNKAFNLTNKNQYKCKNKRTKIDNIKIGTTTTALISILSLNTFVIQEVLAIDVTNIIENIKEDEMEKETKYIGENEEFKNSELFKKLKEKTELNKEKNKKELSEKYCYRQAEIGVGDCGGLRLIPGATKTGRQKPPEWLNKLINPLLNKESSEK